MIKEPTSTKPPITGVGVLCVVLGVLILIPSGGCAGILVGLVIYSMGTGDPVGSTLADAGPMMLGAALPVGIGIVLIWAGLQMRRGS